MDAYESEGMPGDDASPSQPEETAEPQSEDDNNDESGPEGVTTLVPKSICPGMELKPGQKLEFEVVKTYEDEVEVKYVNSKEEQSEMDRSESKLNDMAEAPPA
jgi:hypothetical protein